MIENAKKTQTAPAEERCLVLPTRSGFAHHAVTIHHRSFTVTKNESVVKNNKALNGTKPIVSRISVHERSNFG